MNFTFETFIIINNNNITKLCFNISMTDCILCIDIQHYFIKYYVKTSIALENVVPIKN